MMRVLAVAALLVCACGGGSAPTGSNYTPPDLPQATPFTTARLQVAGGSDDIGTSLQLRGLLPVSQGGGLYLMILTDQLRHGSARHHLEIGLGAQALTPGDYACTSGHDAEGLDFDLANGQCYVIYINDDSRTLLEESWFSSPGTCSIHVSESTVGTDTLFERFHATFECRSMPDRKTVQFPDDADYPGPLPALTLTGTIDSTSDGGPDEIGHGSMIDAVLSTTGGDDQLPPTLALRSSGASVGDDMNFHMILMSQDQPISIDVVFGAPYQVVGEYTNITPNLTAYTLLEQGTFFVQVLRRDFHPDGRNPIPIWISVAGPPCTLDILAATYDPASPFVRNMSGRIDCAGIPSIDKLMPAAATPFADLEIHGTFHTQ